jgi:Family of unknown function (DUF5677)
MKKPSAALDPHEIFLHAYHFHESDHRLRKGPSTKDIDEVMLIAHPSMVLSAFASELYLKCLLCVETGKVPKEHHLKSLFLRLDLSTRKRLQDLWNESLKRPERQRELDCIRGLPEGDQLQPDLLNVLGLCSNAFEELRYLYETKGSYFLLHNFPDMLHTVILERFPDWGFVTPTKNVVRTCRHMSIDEQGFLSPDIAAYIDKHRAENGAWFNHAMDLNSVAQQLLQEVPLDDETFLSTLLFVRGLSSFQAAILLAERGMIQDARTVARSCFETVFCFGALRKDPVGFLEKFEKANLHSKKTFANASLKGGVKLEPDVAKKLSQFLDDFERSGEKAEQLKWKGAANAAGLGNVYDVLYRGLSNDSAHPSLIALKRYYEVNENNTELRWGPAALDKKDIEDTLVASCTACWYLVEWMAERAKHPEIMEKLKRCSEDIKRLIEVKATD